MSRYLETGKIVNTFGIKGELKVISDSTTNRFFVGSKLFLGKNTNSLIEVEITSCRVHQNNYLVTINNIQDINEVLKYINSYFYVDRDLLDDLKENEYYFIDLVGKKIMSNSKIIGIVEDVYELPKHAVLEILIDSKKYLIPFVNAYIKDVLEDTIIVDRIEEFL